MEWFVLNTVAVNGMICVEHCGCEWNNLCLSKSVYKDVKVHLIGFPFNGKL